MVHTPLDNIDDKAISDDPVLLMCSPDYYEIRPPHPEAGFCNDFVVQGYKEYSANPVVFRKQAQKQWKALCAIFKAAGVEVVEIEPNEKSTGQVFTADPSLSIVSKNENNGTLSAVTILSRFSNEERQTEVEDTANFFEKKTADRPLVQSHYRFEGTGDNVYDSFRDVFWSGYVVNPSRKTASSGRSDLRAHKALSALTGVDVISLAVKRPFFHIDTAMAPLSKGHIVCFEDGMQPEAFKKLKAEAFDRFGLCSDDYLIPVSSDDAKKYGCNLVSFGDLVVMPDCSASLKGAISRAGYEVVTTDMSRFIYCGGAIHCVVNNINQRRIVGGTALAHGYSRKDALHL